MKASTYLLTLFLMGCGAPDAIKSAKDIPGHLDKMQGELENTTCTLKRGISFEALLKEEHTRDLSTQNPVPYDLIPFAKNFAQCASKEDLAEVVHLWMKKLNDVKLTVKKPTEEQIAQFDLHKFHVYSALGAVSAFISDEKINGLIQEQVNGSGRFQENVMQLLMLRVMFIRDILLADALNSVGKVEKAIEYADQIEFVGRLPFASKIAVKITGFLNTDDYELSESMTSKAVKEVWKSVKFKAEELNAEMGKLVGKPGEDQDLLGARRGKLGASLNLIDQRISGW